MALRQQQAAATRELVVAAALRVFSDRGYGAATIAEVADAAGVAVPTVYKGFTNKRGLLAAVADSWERQSLRPWLSQHAMPTTGSGALRWLAALVRQQWSTGLDLALVYAGAAAAEPDVAADLAPREASRQQLLQQVAAAAGLEDAGAAVCSALTLPEVYRELVRDRGWTPGEYEEWLHRSLLALRRSARSGRRPA